MKQTIDIIKAALAAFDEWHYEAIWAPEPNPVQSARNWADLHSYESSAWSELSRRAYGENDDVWDCVDAHKTIEAVGKYL